MSAAEDAAVVPAGKSAKAGKETKAGKKSRDEGSDAKGSSLMRKMAADLSEVTRAVSRLRADVDTLRRAPAGTPGPDGDRPAAPSRKHQPPSPAEQQILSALSGRGGISVALAVTGQGDAAPYVRVAGAEGLKAADTARVARLGYALSSAPKVALLRLLLDAGEQSAAQLGEGAGLTTGSLYHHLRELVHSEVIHPSSRNRYALTPLGRQMLVAVLALATP